VVRLIIRHVTAESDSQWPRTEVKNCKFNDLKGAVSSIFSITVKSQKTYIYLWKPKNSGPVVLKWVFQYMETITCMSGQG